MTGSNRPSAFRHMIDWTPEQQRSKAMIRSGRLEFDPATCEFLYAGRNVRLAVIEYRVFGFFDLQSGQCGALSHLAEGALGWVEYDEIWLPPTPVRRRPSHRSARCRSGRSELNRLLRWCRLPPCPSLPVISFWKYYVSGQSVGVTADFSRQNSLFLLENIPLPGWLRRSARRGALERPGQEEALPVALASSSTVGAAGVRSVVDDPLGQGAFAADQSSNRPTRCLRSHGRKDEE